MGYTTCAVLRTPYAVCRMLHARTIGPLTPPCVKRRFHISLRVCYNRVEFVNSRFLFSVGHPAQISMYCLLTVHPETSLSQQRSTPVQISDAFSRGRDPIAHARRHRCPAHVGSIFDEFVIVIVTC